MKSCPKCGTIYSEPDLNFCLNDGELLMQSQGGARSSHLIDDAPPTLMMDASRATNPTGWHGGDPGPGTYQPGGPLYQAPQFAMSSLPATADKTLPTVSLILGVFSFVLVCCYGGVWLGIPAAVVGFLGVRNADRDPQRYGGKGMAVAGLILGLVSLAMSLLFLVLGIAGNLS